VAEVFIRFDFFVWAGLTGLTGLRGLTVDPVSQRSSKSQTGQNSEIHFGFWMKYYKSGQIVFPEYKSPDRKGTFNHFIYWKIKLPFSH
jgi:hypothetical protein